MFSKISSFFCVWRFNFLQNMAVRKKEPPAILVQTVTALCSGAYESKCWRVLNCLGPVVSAREEAQHRGLTRRRACFALRCMIQTFSLAPVWSRCRPPVTAGHQHVLHQYSSVTGAALTVTSRCRSWLALAFVEPLHFSSDTLGILLWGCGLRFFYFFYFNLQHMNLIGYLKWPFAHCWVHAPVKFNHLLILICCSYEISCKQNSGIWQIKK